MIEIRRLPAEDLRLVAGIDRSERVDFAYRVERGTLNRYPVDWDITAWHVDGTAAHSVGHNIESLKPVVQAVGVFLGAFDGTALLGIAVIEPRFEPGLAWLAFLHVSRPYRSRGVGTALWNQSERIARNAGADTICVSATPSGPTIDFYLRRGCTLAADPHPDLFAKEPDDIHLVCVL